jgi:hypothetical protein
MVVLTLRRIGRHCWQGIGSSSDCMVFCAQHIMGSSRCITRNDPVGFFLSKGLQLHTLSPHSCTTFVNGRGRGGIAIGIGLNGLTLKCCLRDDDIEAIAFHKGKGNPPRAFAAHHLHSLRLRDFDIGLQNGTATADNATATPNQTQQGASHHGFPDRPLPDKIVVAVDVDEGNFFFSFTISQERSLNHI